MFFRSNLFRFRSDPGPASTLHERFERQVALSPRRIALECDGVRLTYSELNQDANRMARRLVAARVEADAVVSIAMERSAELVATLLAVLKAGGAFAILDGSLPARQREAFIHASGASAIVTDTVRTFPGRTTVRYYAASGVDRNLDRRTQADRWACVIDGKVRSHEAVVKILDETRQEHEFHAGDGLYSAEDLFGQASLELFLPLIAGGRLVLASKQEIQEADRLSERAHASGCRMVRLPKRGPLMVPVYPSRAAVAGADAAGIPSPTP